MSLISIKKFKERDINPTFFQSKYFISTLTGDYKIEDGKLYMQYEGESYRLNKLFSESDKVLELDILKLKLSDIAEKTAIRLLRKGTLKHIVSEYKRPSMVLVSNPKRNIEEELLEELKDSILANTFVIEFKNKKQKEPGCFDGLCIEKKILNGEISFNSREAKW